MKIHPVGAELLHADGRTDMAKLIVAFCNFAKEPKNYFRIADSQSLNSLLMYSMHRRRIYKHLLWENVKCWFMDNEEHRFLAG